MNRLGEWIEDHPKAGFALLALLVLIGACVGDPGVYEFSR